MRWERVAARCSHGIDVDVMLRLHRRQYCARSSLIGFGCSLPLNEASNSLAAACAGLDIQLGRLAWLVSCGWVCVRGVRGSSSGTKPSHGCASLTCVCVCVCVRAFTFCRNWAAAVPLYLGGVAWTIVYDTLYAHQVRVA